MAIKYNLKIFLLTAVISTAVFFATGNIFFKDLVSYGDWILVFLPVNAVLAFIVMLPLLLPFWLMDKRGWGKSLSVAYLVAIRTGIGVVYTTALLWFSIFNNYWARRQDPFNYSEDLRYLGYFTLIAALAFAAIDYYFKNKERNFTGV